jgi:ankyrin repeat protein
MDPNEMLLKASKHNLPDYVKKAVMKGADLNRRSREGKLPIIEASKYGHLNIVMFLAEHGADVNNKDASGNTALVYATKFGHLAIVKYLIEKGAETFTGESELEEVMADVHTSDYLEEKIKQQILSHPK